MVFDVSTAITWLLFLALFPMAFFWLRRAWRIFVRRDFSEVALRRGEAPPDPERWAPYSGVLNLLAGGTALLVILGVLLFGWPYEAWSAIAGSTLWLKIFLDFALGRHAHTATRAKQGRS